MRTVEQFHKSRIAFAELPNRSIATIENDPRGHKRWLKEDFGITDGIFESLIRGYIKDDRVVFYRGSDFKPVNDIYSITRILTILNELTIGLDVYDGVIIGAVGEDWQPLNTISRNNTGLRVVEKRLINDIQLQFVETSSSNPQRFNAYYKGLRIGYLEVSYGRFIVKEDGFEGKVIYYATTLGSGHFYDEFDESNGLFTAANALLCLSKYRYLVTEEESAWMRNQLWLGYIC